MYAANDTWGADVEERWGADQDNLAALTTRGHVTVIPDAGHYIYRDALETSAAAVTTVLSQVTSDQRPAAGARP